MRVDDLVIFLEKVKIFFQAVKDDEGLKEGFCGILSEHLVSSGDSFCRKLGEWLLHMKPKDRVKFWEGVFNGRRVGKVV